MRKLAMVGIVAAVAAASVPAMLTLMASGGDEPEPVPTATPETPAIPEGIISLPASGPPMFTDPVRGFSFSYPADWSIEGSGNDAEEGVLMSVVSADRSVVIDISRALPPPQVPGIDFETHLRGYGEAVLAIMASEIPGFQAVVRRMVELADETPAFAARFAISGDSLSAGEILVVIRSIDDSPGPFNDEAFVLSVTGPVTAYVSSGQDIETVFRGFALTAKGEAPPGP